MSREQIKEIAKDLCQNTMCGLDEWNECELSDGIYCLRCTKLATNLYNAGYRKQSEGEWEDQYQGMYVNQLYKCSVCGETAFHDDKRWFLTPYCPNCGAKMKGGAE